MTQLEHIKITKSDFNLYRQAPRHLWAKKHGRIEQPLSEFIQHLSDDGYAVERLAMDYFNSLYLPRHPGVELRAQQTFSDGPFEARVDALLFDRAKGDYSLYEIKSSNEPNKDHLYDLAFQAAIVHATLPATRFYLMHLNKDYIRDGELDLEQLLCADDVTDDVLALLPEIATLREEALHAALESDPEALGFCLAPRACPCPGVCHPDLPEFSIYDIPYLSKPIKAELLSRGIRAARDIPDGFGLNAKQRLVVERARTNTDHLDRARLKAELGGLRFPLWFLDYETCISAVPLFDGYHSQQQVVFQYSLQRLDQPGGEAWSGGHLELGPGDPASRLLERLSAELGQTGSVLVWSKTFEMSRNREMARLYPQYAAFLEDVNARIYDLAEIINQGIYLHPGFKGRYSLKHVLPVMVSDLDYQELAIREGGQASTAWWRITFGEIDAEEKQSLAEALERYCQVDTFGMVQIFERLWGMM